MLAGYGRPNSSRAFSDLHEINNQMKNNKKKEGWGLNRGQSPEAPEAALMRNGPAHRVLYVP